MRFKLTRDQILNRTQTVTRRTGWTFLKTDDIVDAYVNDLRRTGEVFTGLFVFGEQIRVVSVRTEPLSRMEQTEYGDREAKLEGFPHMTGAEFVTMYCKAQGGQPSQDGYEDRIRILRLNIHSTHETRGETRAIQTVENIFLDAA